MAAYKYTLSDLDLNRPCELPAGEVLLEFRYTPTRIRAIGCVDTEEIMFACIGRGRGVISLTATAGLLFPLTLARCTCPDRKPSCWGPERHREIRIWRSAGRHHGPADREEDRDPHHGLQQRGRTLRIPQARSRNLHPWDRAAARISSVCQGELEINGPDEFDDITLRRVTNAELLPPRRRSWRR